MPQSHTHTHTQQHDLLVSESTRLDQPPHSDGCWTFSSLPTSSRKRYQPGNEMCSRHHTDTPRVHDNGAQARHATTANKQKYHHH